MRVFEITGNMASGKDYVGTKIYEILANKGQSIVKINFASSLKKIIKDSLGIQKNGNPLKTIDEIFINDVVDYLFREYSVIYGPLIYFDYFRVMYNLNKGKENSILNQFKKIIVNIFQHFEDNNHDEFNSSIRYLLQFFGTEFVRNCVNKNFWVDVVKSKIKKLQKLGIENVIITDFRFPNEELIFNGLFDDDINVFKIKVTASNIVRAERLNTSVEKLIEMSNHPSESQVEDLSYDYIIDNSSTNDEIKIKHKDTKKVLYLSEIL